MHGMLNSLVGELHVPWDVGPCRLCAVLKLVLVRSPSSPGFSRGSPTRVSRGPLTTPSAMVFVILPKSDDKYRILTYDHNIFFSLISLLFGSF